MPPSVATVAFAVLIAVLFRLDRDGRARTSPALWLAVIWTFIGASRMASQWFGGDATTPMAAVDLYVEGSPFDRLFLGGMLVAGLIVLIARGEDSSRLLRANAPLLVFFLYCAVSILWSDFPLVAFKRWTKAIGNITMVLVVLTDPNPSAAVKRFFSRTAFLLIPLSLLLIKYYPAMGRLYNRWTWSWTSIGVSSDKNGLGALCLVFGLASVWQFFNAWRDNTEPNRSRHLTAHAVVIGLTLLLLVMADSSTALACFILGTVILFLAAPPGNMRPVRPNVIVVTIVMGALLSFFFQDLYEFIVEGLGRKTTLTGRTEIWDDLFKMVVNPWLGTGYETFWLGSRAAQLWEKYYFHPNQAHNGYIETYINLGWIGVALLIVLIVSGHRNTRKMNRQDASSLTLAYFVVALLYNITEAAFKVMHPLWIAFLLAVAAWPPLPESSEKRDPSTDDVLVPRAVGQSAAHPADLPAVLAARTAGRCAPSEATPT